MPVALRESGSALLSSRALIWAVAVYPALIAVCAPFVAPWSALFVCWTWAA